MIKNKVSGIFRFKLIMELYFVDNCKVAFGSRYLIGSRSDNAIDTLSNRRKSIPSSVSSSSFSWPPSGLGMNNKTAYSSVKL